jgi:DNA ligase (NAD+)
MNKNEVKNRIAKLREEISRLRYLYHVKDSPEVTDEVYDSLIKELTILVKKYPEFDDPNSPEKRVGGEPLDKFEKVKHEMRMFSIGNVFNEDELFAWENRNLKLLPANTKLDYFCELKLDGLAISLIYENGKFVRGVTRGDGSIGEDITSNLRMIDTMPLVLSAPYPKKIEVRGEVIMKKEILDILNEKNKKQGKALFANSRNAAAGSLRQLDPNIMKERKLDFFAYEIAQIKGSDFEKNILEHSKKHEFLKKLGFTVEEHFRFYSNIKDVPYFIEEIKNIREDLAFGIDGVVININNTKIFEKLGVVGKDPRGIIAYKFPAEKATTIVKDISISVGRTGVLTPLAHFDKTLVSGSVVSKATLHNMDQIQRLGIKIGDTVVIEKAGDVIPSVVEVLKKMRTGKEKDFKMPKYCPVCGGVVERRDVKNETETSSKNALRSPTGTSREIFQQKNIRAFFEDVSVKRRISSVAYYCTNKDCGARNSRSMQHFVNVYEIYEIGPKILDRLKEEGLISDASDLFTLEKSDLVNLERFGEKSADNIINSIEDHKRVPFWRFIYALGIVHVGEQTARDLADHFHNLDKLMNADLEELNSIENIGIAVSESIWQYFRDKNNINFINRLLKNGVKIIEEKKRVGNFTGKTFVLTGTLPTLSRENAKKMIIENGGKVSSSVSSKTDFVLAGEESGSKLKDAQKFGIKIISEQEFLKMM